MRCYLKYNAPLQQQKNGITLHNIVRECSCMPMAITRVQHISERRQCRAIWARISIWILTMTFRSMRVGQKMPSKFNQFNYVSVKRLIFFDFFSGKSIVLYPFAQKFPLCCHNPTTIRIIEKIKKKNFKRNSKNFIQKLIYLYVFECSVSVSF